MGGRPLGPVDGGPGRHEGGTGAFARAGGQRQVHLPHPDPDIPAAAAQGVQADLHNLGGPVHHALDLVAN